MLFVNDKKENVSWISLIAKSAFLLLILYFSAVLVFSKKHWIFLDGVNLLIHESGHLVFGFGGVMLSFSGGTIMQLLIPVLFLLYFLLRRDFFSSGFCFFWIGDNLLNISFYIKDARKMVMPLIGGGVHDWNFLLSRWHLLEQSNLIGNFVYLLGLVFLVSGVCLISVILFYEAFHKFKLFEK